MRDFILLFSLILILGSIIGLVPSSATFTNPNNSGATSDAYCSSCSEIAKLLCFANRNFDGFNYVFLNFNKEKVVAVAGYYYDCDPGNGIFYFRFMKVQGFLVEVTYEGAAILYYINLVRNGCPSITLVPQSGKLHLPTGGLDRVLPDTVVSLSLAYLGFTAITGNNYNAECNQFTQVTDNCDCSCQSPQILRRPAAIVSLAKCTSVVTGYLFKANDNVTGAGVYADAYGLSNVKCRKQAGFQARSNPPIYVETCSTNDNENRYCNYRGPSYNFKIGKKYYSGETLNNAEILQLARFYENAYYANKEPNSFLSLLFFPRLDREPEYAFTKKATRDAVSYFLLDGLIPGSLRYHMMGPLMSIR